MLRTIDLLRTVCRRHEHNRPPLHASPGAAKARKCRPAVGHADAVLSRSALTMTRARVQTDMAEMMQYFSIDLGALPHYRERLREAEDVCAHCPTVARCYRWKHKGGQGDAPQLFCPNVELFWELATEQYDWPCKPAALPWSHLLGSGSKEVSINPPDIGSGKLRAFVEAALKVDRTVEKWTPRIRAANGEDYAEKLRRKADLDMAAAIEETDGMTFDDYRTIYHVALCDSAIAGKLKDFFEQRTAD